MMRLFLACILLVLIGCNDNDSHATNTTTTAVTGEQLFKINCAQCHKPATDFAAPALAGVQSRWASKDLLYRFVRNPEEVIRKDKYAYELFIKWRQAPMQAFPYLSDADMDAIFKYANEAAAK